MAYRVNPEEVKEIIETNVPDTAIEAYIAGADAIVTGLLVGLGMPDALLKEIERWLTAHLIACSRDRQVREEVAGGARISYFSEYSMVGKGLDATLYGQQAKILDTTGTLAMSTVAKLPASVYAVTSFA
jgi:hypothetical protein